MTLTVLAASVGDIDTSDQLEATSIFGKVFITNGANLKVFDYINVKIATTDVGANAPDFGTLLTGGTSGAKMIVDYITTTSGACTIYGYRTTTETFSTEVVTGTDDDGNAISFTTSGAETAKPHWYDYTVFGGDTANNGTMPDLAYLTCPYRGRVVLAGNPTYPNQWYMSKTSNPFNYLYGTDDPMSAVAGNNADAGQCPDIIRALIPFHDDYLIFGGATSMWILRGDPVAGGSLDSLDSTTGIFGDRSWCFDGENNLYFWSNSGISMIPAAVLTSNTGILDLTQVLLPNILTDESPDPTTHRITMGYDKKRHGIVVCITVLSTGVNSNYFYSLETKGFYPETYPEECGAYSLFYYAANDPDDADLLVGCRDGYIRKFDNSAKNDDVGASNEAISSYMTYPIIPLAYDSNGVPIVDTNGKLTQLVFDTSGGAASGTFDDTDGFTYSLYVGNDAETVLENIIDGETPFLSGTISGSGRQNKIRTRARGAYVGLKISNSTASESWGINRVLYDSILAGRL